MSRVLRFASDLLGRAQIAGRAGITFAGKRDLYEACGYKRSLGPQDYMERYRRGGIAARVAEALPKATWRGGVELVDDEDPDTTTEFEQAFLDLDARVHVWATFLRADILAGLGRFSVVLIGAPGDPSTELPESLKLEDVAYLSAYGEASATVNLTEMDVSSPRYGLPVMYSLARSGQANLIVHWSRVLHIADNVLDDLVYGNARLERVWNYLDDLDKVTGCGSEAYWRRADPGLVFKFDKDTEMDPAESLKIQEAADDLQHGLRRNMALRGGEVTPLSASVSAFNQQVDSIITLIAGASEIPQRILVGSEMGQLASGQDKENWDTRVSDRRRDFAEPYVVRPFVELLIKHGALPEPNEDQFSVRWPEMLSQTEAEQADIAVKWSGLNAAMGDTVVTAAEIRDRVLGLDPLTESQESEEEPAPAAPPAPEEKPPAGASGRAAANAPWQVALARSRRAMVKAATIVATKKARGAVNRKALARAVFDKDQDAMLAALAPGLDLLSETMKAVAKPLALVYEQAKIRSRGSRHASGAGPALRKAARGGDWAADRVGQLVTGMTEGARGEISDLVSKWQERGWQDRTLVSRIERIIDLTPRQMDAADGLRERLMAAEPGDIVKAGDREFRVPKNAHDDWVERRVLDYEGDLLESRADAIARTECAAAVRDGQIDEWRESQEDGELPEGVQMIWLNGDDPCSVCADMNGETSGIGEPFDVDGEQSEGPPLHTNCECHLELFEEKRR